MVETVIYGKEAEREDYTLVEAAEKLRISWQTVRRLIIDGGIKGHKVGREWRIHKTEIEHVLKEGVRERKKC